MAHDVLAIAGSPRRGGNSEQLLDRALAGAAEADPAARVRKIVLNELEIRPCRSCGYCSGTGTCRFAQDDAMRDIYPALERADRFLIASPVYFGNVPAQLKAMIDRCQAVWARKYLLHRSHDNADRKALFLCCGGFKHDRFFRCARRVILAWCTVMDIQLIADRFYPAIDAMGDIAGHPSALREAFDAGRTLLTDG